MLKTSPEHVAALARSVARTSGARVVALCSSGVVHAFFPGSADVVADAGALVSQAAASLHAIGGHAHSRHVPAATPSDREAVWIAQLDREFRNP